VMRMPIARAGWARTGAALGDPPGRREILDADPVASNAPPRP
jgi:hypothetical protein